MWVAKEECMLGVANSCVCLAFLYMLVVLLCVYGAVFCVILYLVVWVALGSLC